MDAAIETSAAASTAGEAVSEAMDESQPALAETKRKLDLSQPVCGQNKRSKVEALRRNEDHGAESSSNKDGSPGQENKAPVLNSMQPPPPVPGAKPKAEYAKISASEAATLLRACKQEAQQGRQEILRQTPLQSLQDISARTADRTALNKTEVAECLIGCNLPLTDVAQQLLQIYLDSHPETSVSGIAIRNCILELATRKSFAPGKAAESADAMEDADPAHLWMWELRDLRTLPKAVRTEATARKKRLKQVSDRLAALDEATQQLHALAEGKAASAKLSRAMARLDKTESLAWMDTPALPCTATQAVKATPDAAAATPASQAEHEAAGQDKEAKRADKAAESARKKAEKEQATAEKRREKEEAAEEKRQEKERVRQEKLAEKEAQQREKEAARESKAKQKGVKGFGSTKAMQKSSNVLKSFFGGTPKRASTPGLSSSSSDEPKQGSSISPELRYHKLFPPPAPGGPMLVLLKEPARNSAHFEHQLKLRAPSEQLQAEHEQRLQRWRSRKRHSREWGLPPTWARKEGTREAVQQLRQATQQGDMSIALYRWKFLHFPADSHRPPYHGSFQKLSCKATARNPWGRDDSMDYDVMSDQEWEEEPEGESLSEEEPDEDEAQLGEDSEGEGFVVSDHYLSDDEGVHCAQMKLDDMRADLQDEVMSEAQDGTEPATPLAPASNFKKLEEAIATAKGAGRMLLISALEPAASDASEQSTLHLIGDPALLACMSAKVLVPGEQITMPGDSSTAPIQADAGTGTAVIPVADTAEGKKNVHKGGSGRGRPAGHWPQELTPQLVDWLKTHPHIHSLDKAVQRFLEDSSCVVAKKHVRDKIKELAKGTSGGWVFKSEPAEEAPGAQATAAARAEATDAVPAAAAAAKADINSKKAATALVPPKAAPAASAGHNVPTAHVTITNFFAKTPASQQAAASRQPPAAPRPSPKLLMDLMEAEDASRPVPATDAVYPANAADPFWQRLVGSMQEGAAGTAAEQEPSQLLRVFQEPHLNKILPKMPQYLTTVLATACASPAAPVQLRVKCAQGLTGIVEKLKAASLQPTPVKSTLQRMDSHELTHPPIVSLTSIYGSCRLASSVISFAAGSSCSEPQRMAAARLIGALLGGEKPQAAAAQPQEAAHAAALSSCRLTFAGNAGFIAVLAAWLVHGEEATAASSEASVPACAAAALLGVLADDASAKKLLQQDDGSIQKLLAALRQLQAAEKVKEPAQQCLKLLEAGLKLN